MEEDREARMRRKQEARNNKRKRIKEAGGIRPRKQQQNEGEANTSSRVKKKGTISVGGVGQHRFGRVMRSVPCRNKPRFYTVSIAIPGSVVSNCQTKELKTQLVGQIARAATIYHVDEIVVFDDKLADEKKESGWYRRRREDEHQRKDRNETMPKGSNPHVFTARILQYCECPQYLRRSFFPMHPDLQFSGLLCPIDAPHHVRADDECKYREGVVLDKKGEGGSLVNCGIRKRPVEIDRVLSPGMRCTVELGAEAYRAGQPKGKVVSPSAPREDDGSYWGYTTRVASSLNAVFDECPFGEGYDLKIGTSERGDLTVDSNKFTLPNFRHALVVFGGVAGIEECVDADESMKIPGSQSKKMFDLWINTCPFQGSRTIRTEEAVMISLARLSPFLARSEVTREARETPGGEDLLNRVGDASSSEDDVPSDESSDPES